MIYIDNGEIKYSDYIFMFDAFKTLYDKDTSKKKETFNNYMLYMFFMFDVNSPYFDYPEDKRHEYVMNNILKNAKLKINDANFKECIAVYKSIRPIEIKLLEDSITACYKLGEFLKNINYEELDDKGKPKYNPKQVSDILNNIGKTISSLKELRKKAKESVANNEYIEKELYEDD